MARNTRQRSLLAHFLLGVIRCWAGSRFSADQSLGNDPRLFISTPYSHHRLHTINKDRRGASTSITRISIPFATMSSATESTPWVERYRPKSLAEVSHQNEVVATLQNATATGRLPHLLLYGPPGSGKVRTRHVL
jgi:hypothetical protein